MSQQQPVKLELYKMVQAKLVHGRLNPIEISKLEKIVFFIELMNKYPKFSEAVYSDYVKNGDKSKFSITKVISLVSHYACTLTYLP